MIQTIYIAGGCFWGVEKYLQSIPGVMSTSVGYANGKTENPTYEDVCKNHTGHVETVKVNYDQNLITLSDILELFFQIIDPTSLNKQGNDKGEQYRTGIYYIESEDRETIQRSLEILQQGVSQPVVVECKPLDQFFPAEEYHQKYLDKNPTGYCHIHPRMFALAAEGVKKER